MMAMLPPRWQAATASRDVASASVVAQFTRRGNFGCQVAPMDPIKSPLGRGQPKCVGVLVTDTNVVEKSPGGVMVLKVVLLVARGGVDAGAVCRAFAARLRP